MNKLRTKVRSVPLVYTIAMLIIIFLIAFFPNIGSAIDWASPQRGPSDDWHDTLVWMRGNTTEPVEGEEYGVMSWWDPGYWITYIGQRAPNAMPGGNTRAKEAGEFLLAQSEEEGSAMLDELDTRYVILDNSNAFVIFDSGRLMGEFHAFVSWAKRSQQDYYEVCYEVVEGRLSPILLYYPMYYQSMVSRLYIFEGKQWVPPQVTVVLLEQQQVTGGDGSMFTVKVIADEQVFSSYGEAVGFIAGNVGYRIVGREPYNSPVPLEGLVGYELVYKSPTVVVSGGARSISEVEVFEYSGL